MKPKYDKPALSVDAQVERLVGRGLDVGDGTALRVFLTRVSYYRLRGYTYPFQNNGLAGQPFRAGVRWNRIEDLYEFDHTLRVLVMGTMESIEIFLRTQLVLNMSLAHGANWYEDPRYFRDASRWRSDLEKLRQEWERSHDEFVRHHDATYDNSIGPPAWKVFETASLGQVSKFLENLRNDLDAKNALLANFGLASGATSVLASWIRHLNVVRNICAHHGRLWNRVIRVRPSFPRTTRGPWVEAWPDSERVWTTLTILL